MSDKTNSLAYYKNSLKDCKVIPNSKIKELFLKYRKEGDKAAYEAIVKSNLRLVYKIASFYKDGNIPQEDLIQEGNIGLVKAIQNYDLEKSDKFSTYAYYWIRQCLNRAVQKSSIIRIPYKKQEEIYKKNPNSKQSETLRNLAKTTDLEKFNDKNMDLNSGEDMFLNLNERMEVSKLNTIIEQCFDSDMEKNIFLSRKVIGRNKKTLSELSKEYNMSIQSIKYIEDKAFKKVREAVLKNKNYFNYE